MEVQDEPLDLSPDEEQVDNPFDSGSDEMLLQPSPESEVERNKRKKTKTTSLFLKISFTRLANSS